MGTYVVGAGAQGRIVLDILRAAEPGEKVEFLDDNRELWGREVDGARVAGDLEFGLRQPVGLWRMIVAIGRPVQRLRVGQKIRDHAAPLRNAIHPSAVVMGSSVVGQDNVLAALAAIGVNARLGDHVLINTGAVVEHDTVVEDGATICPGAQVGGRAHVGRGAFVCTGAIILPRLSVGAGSIVAAGAVATKDIPEGVLVAGIPGRVVGSVGENYDWSRLL